MLFKLTAFLFPGKMHQKKIMTHPALMVYVCMFVLFIYHLSNQILSLWRMSLPLTPPYIAID